MWFAVKEVSMVEQDKQAQQRIAQLMQVCLGFPSHRILSTKILWTTFILIVLSKLSIEVVIKCALMH